MNFYIASEVLGMTKKIKAWVQESLCEGIVYVHFNDGKGNTCHEDNVECWLASKGITPEETGKYEDMEKDG